MRTFPSSSPSSSRPPTTRSTFSSSTFRRAVSFGPSDRLGQVDPACIPLPPSPRAPSRIPVPRRSSSSGATGLKSCASIIVSSLPTTTYISLWTPPHRLPPHPPQYPSRVILPSVFRSNSQIRVVSNSTSLRRVSSSSSASSGASSKRTSAYLASSSELPSVPTWEDEGELEDEVEPGCPLLPFSGSELTTALGKIASTSKSDVSLPLDSKPSTPTNDNFAPSTPPPVVLSTRAPTPALAGLDHPIEDDPSARAINIPLPPSPSPSSSSFSAPNTFPMPAPSLSPPISNLNHTGTQSGAQILSPPPPLPQLLPTSSSVQLPAAPDALTSVPAPKLQTRSSIAHILDEWEEIERLEAALSPLFDKGNPSRQNRRWWQTAKAKTSVRKEAKKSRPGSLVGLLTKIV